MKSHRACLSDADDAAHVAAKLANFKGRAGQHGPLATVRVKLSGRISREAHLRLGSIATANGLKRGALESMALEAFSRIESDQLYPVLADLAGQRSR